LRFLLKFRGTVLLNESNMAISRLSYSEETSCRIPPFCRFEPVGLFVSSHNHNTSQGCKPESFLKNILKNFFECINLSKNWLRAAHTIFLLRQKMGHPAQGRLAHSGKIAGLAYKK